MRADLGTDRKSFYCQEVSALYHTIRVATPSFIPLCVYCIWLQFHERLSELFFKAMAMDTCAFKEPFAVKSHMVPSKPVTVVDQ